jgi:hypothetical protein
MSKLLNDLADAGHECAMRLRGEYHDKILTYVNLYNQAVIRGEIDGPVGFRERLQIDELRAAVKLVVDNHYKGTDRTGRNIKDDMRALRDLLPNDKITGAEASGASPCWAAFNLTTKE